MQVTPRICWFTKGMTKTIETPKKSKYDFTKLNTLSVVSLATALTSVGAVAAIITGHISLAQIKRSGENGRPLALAGVILGYVTIAIWVVGTVFWTAFAFWAAKNGYAEMGDFGDMRHMGDMGGQMSGYFDSRGDGPHMMN